MIAVCLGLVASSALASISRHAVLVSSLVDETDALFHPSPRAPLLNQCPGIRGQRSEISEADNASGTIQYRHDKAGAVTNIVYPGNFTVAYGWDTAGRLVSVKDWASREWTFNYDGGNRLTGIQYPNGTTAQRGYNADGQLTNLVYSKSGTPFISRAFERNAAGLKTREVISAGLEAEPGDTWQKHTSDKADRLTGVTRRDEYVVPERWRGYTPSYNQEGQVTNINEGYRAWSSANNLTWDDAGRLIEYTGLRQTNLWTDTPPLPSWGLELGYDGLGARTVRTDELVTHRLVVDRVGRLKVPLAELDQNNAAVRYFVWAPGIGLLTQIEADGTIHYFHADENGSTLAMTDASGNVSDQFAYSPWGELIGRTGTNTTDFTFVGGGGVYWEGGSLYRMGARYYDARLKRWLSADPIGMAGGANLYLYCNGNPLYWVDLLGLKPDGQSRQTYIQNSGPDWMYSDGPVEGPGVIGGSVPLIGPMREAAANRMNGQYGWMAVNTGFAMADVVSLGRATVARDLLGVGMREAGEVVARDAMERSVVNIGEDLSSASGTRVWRNISGGHPALADAQAGVIRPYGPIIDAPLDVRAVGHDLGYTQGSGLTSWSADQSWALSRQQQLGGIVVETVAPEGSIWLNEAAKGVESQVLIPGTIRVR